MKPPLRLPHGDLAVGLAPLPPDTAKYVSRVHRRGPGDYVLLFDPEACTEAEAVLRAGPGRQLQVEVESVRAAESGAMPVTLLQALGKGDKPEHVVRDATVLGAQSVAFVQTDRCVAQAKGSNRLARWNRVALEAARQSGRSDLPRLTAPVLLSQALRRLGISPAEKHVAAQGEPAPSAAETRTRRLLCHTGPQAVSIVESLAGWPAAAQQREQREPVVVLIGPEGGLSRQEVEEARTVGFNPVALTEHVLRTETASTVVLGYLACLWAARGK